RRRAVEERAAVGRHVVDGQAAGDALDDALAALQRHGVEGGVGAHVGGGEPDLVTPGPGEPRDRGPNRGQVARVTGAIHDHHVAAIVVGHAEVQERDVLAVGREARADDAARRLVEYVADRVFEAVLAVDRTAA